MIILTQEQIDFVAWQLPHSDCASICEALRVMCALEQEGMANA